MEAGGREYREPLIGLSKPAISSLPCVQQRVQHGLDPAWRGPCLSYDEIARWFLILTRSRFAVVGLFAAREGE
jgi:hypothetical protein